MTKRDSTTPLQAARQYAEAHPEFEGRVEVTVLRPKGRGGWGVTRTTTTAWARDGKAAVSRSLRVGNVEAWSWNGQCVACGRVHLEPVLARVYRYDERVGRPLGPENAAKRDEFERGRAWYEKERGEPVYAPRCSIYGVCPTCAEALWMAPPASWPGALGRNEVECAPAGFVPKPAPPMVEIDLSRTNE